MLKETEMKEVKVKMFALAAYGKGISGGDRIFIEFARRWSSQNNTKVFVWEEGYEMCKRQNLQKTSVKFNISYLLKWMPLGFAINYIIRTIEGIKIGLTYKILRADLTGQVVAYSSSEFLMDVLPAFLLKLRYPSVIWVATWFQTAPSPLKGFSEGDRQNKYRLNALAYWFVQQISKPFISGFSDFVLVNNENEKKVFKKHDKKGKAIVVIGAVPLEVIKTFKKKIGKQKCIYDAVFQGRFHAQKGVVELIKIWKKVVNKIPDAKLAMVGDGPLMPAVKDEITVFGLENNIVLFGYQFDGEEKYKIFAQSRVVVHPAFFDSGGMASAEAMAFGIPCVGFNLPSYKSYYPAGMVKVETSNLEAFSEAIIRLLKHHEERKILGKEAEQLVEKQMNWDVRAKEVLDAILTK